MRCLQYVNNSNISRSPGFRSGIISMFVGRQQFYPSRSHNCLLAMSSNPVFDLREKYISLWSSHRTHCKRGKKSNGLRHQWIPSSPWSSMGYFTKEYLKTLWLECHNPGLLWVHGRPLLSTLLSCLAFHTFKSSGSSNPSRPMQTRSTLQRFQIYEKSA